MGDYKLHVLQEGVGMGEIQFKIYYKKKSTCSFCHVVNFVTANHQPTEIEEPRALLRLFLPFPGLPRSPIIRLSGCATPLQTRNGRTRPQQGITER